MHHAEHCSSLSQHNGTEEQQCPCDRRLTNRASNHCVWWNRTYCARVLFRAREVEKKAKQMKKERDVNNTEWKNKKHRRKWTKIGKTKTKEEIKKTRKKGRTKKEVTNEPKLRLHEQKQWQSCAFQYLFSWLFYDAVFTVQDRELNKMLQNICNSSIETQVPRTGSKPFLCHTPKFTDTNWGKPWVSAT